MLHDGLRNFQLLGSQAMLFQHLWQNVAHANIDFLVQHITREFNHIHAVQQRTRDLIFHIACTDEEHLREIKGILPDSDQQKCYSAQGQAPLAELRQDLRDTQRRAYQSRRAGKPDCAHQRFSSTG